MRNNNKPVVTKNKWGRSILSLSNDEAECSSSSENAGQLSN
jgi:hypothetical protein